MSNQYINTIMEKGSANDALTTHRNLALAQGRGADALMMEHARGMKLQGLPQKPANWDQMTEDEKRAHIRGSCFTGDTMIETPSGKKKISAMKRGDKIISYSKGKKTTEYVKNAVVYPPAKVWDFILSNDTKVSATDHHTVLTTKGWKKLGDLVVGESKLVCPDTGKHVIIKHKTNPRRELVYNLHTTGSHNFIANGLVAHNFTFARRFRSLLSTLAEKTLVIDTHRPLEVNF